MFELLIVVLAPFMLIAILWILNTVNHFIGAGIDCGGWPSYEAVKRSCIKEEHQDSFSRWNYLDLMFGL